MSRGSLILVRHGESMGNLWPNAFENDERNFLTQYGVMQAQLCGHYLKHTGLEFDLVVSSRMTRARHTMATILYELGWQRDWAIDSGFNELERYRGESPLRIHVATKALLDKWKAGNCLVVCHYHTIEEICRAIGIAIPEYVQHATPYEYVPGATKLKQFDISGVKTAHPNSPHRYIK